MNLTRLFFYFLLLLGISFIPSISLANEIDDECKTFCINNRFKDGHYLPPEPGAACREGYFQNRENEICCCKPTQT